MYLCTTVLLHVHIYLSSEATEESKDELREGKGKVLVEEISKEGRHSVVRPLTMYQQKTL